MWNELNRWMLDRAGHLCLCGGTLVVVVNDGWPNLECATCHASNTKTGKFIPLVKDDPRRQSPIDPRPSRPQ